MNGPPSTERFELRRMACVNCTSSSLRRGEVEALVCDACGRAYAIDEGVPIMLLDPELKTKLEGNETADIYKVDEAAIQNAFQQWGPLLNDLEVERGTVLEIGAGTGRLSGGLIRYGDFDEVHLVDLSAAFLKAIQAREEAPHARFYVCDANRLPFQEAQFDVVVGRSILHHLLDYQGTLRQVRRLLKPTGVALFFEPILQGKALIAFFLSAMLRLEESFESAVFSDTQRKKIAFLVRHLTKSKRAAGNLEKLATMEDKYIFDLDEMGALAEELGFRRFRHLNLPGKEGRRAAWGYRPYVFHHIRKFDVTEEQMNRFAALFECFGETFSDLMPDSVKTPMGYLIFEGTSTHL